MGDVAAHSAERGAVNDFSTLASIGVRDLDQSTVLRSQLLHRSDTGICHFWIQVIQNWLKRRTLPLLTLID